MRPSDRGSLRGEAQDLPRLRFIRRNGRRPTAEHVAYESRNCFSRIMGFDAMTVAAASLANVLWFLPTHGDGHHLGSAVGARPVDINYLRQIAEAADYLGYFGALLPTGRICEDSWVIASALAPATGRLRFLVAVRPGLQSPTLA